MCTIFRHCRLLVKKRTSPAQNMKLKRDTCFPYTVDDDQSGSIRTQLKSRSHMPCAGDIGLRWSLTGLPVAGNRYPNWMDCYPQRPTGSFPHLPRPAG